MIANNKNKLTPYELKFWFKDKAKYFKYFKNRVLDSKDDKKHRIFFDNGADILLVSHIDTVKKPQFKKRKQQKIYAAGLDDRLGCFLGYKLMKQYNLDFLITDNEECGQSTALFHKTKKYNWIVQLDREWNDVVNYGLSSDCFDEALKEFWKIGIGSYSDICDIDSDCCCFNLGLGIKHSHSDDSYFDVDVFNSQVERFRLFYNKHKDTRFLKSDDYNSRYYCDKYYTNNWYKTESTYDCYDDDDSGFLQCDYCGGYNARKIFDFHLCRDCIQYLIDNDLALYNASDSTTNDFADEVI